MLLFKKLFCENECLDNIFLFTTEIPRVVNIMMTQNEAPEPPNEDPTYERYQSSEQRGMKVNYLEVIFYPQLQASFRCAI